MKNVMNSKKERNSNFELLRIVSMFGIINMHAYSTFYSSATGTNQFYGVVINSIFNMGVSLFMLISGYFGLHFSVKKMVSLEITILGYSIIGLIVDIFLFGTPLNESMILKSFFPVLTRKYWYMSVYMMLLCCAPYINLIPKRLKKKSFERLLCILVFFLYVAPSFLYLEIMQDSGKGLANMFVVYLIGCYIREYVGKQDLKHLVCGGAITILAGIVCNFALTLFKQKDGGLFCPFARDLSITILLGSVFVFLIFREIEIKSIFINKIARCTFAMYLIEGYVRAGLNNSFFDIRRFGNDPYLPAYILIYALLTMAICICIDMARKCLFSGTENAIVENASEKIKKIARALLHTS